KVELEQLLQEWMVNMKKHSQATVVSVSFERTGKDLQIFYTDNGIGFPEPIPYGHGLKNTGNRMEKLGGTINFANGSPKGARIHLTLPTV
ncbi:MAG: ATP-binding protein, partial [Mucilaginibacter sp.]|nr:ATP-binding protein [Mucilaginibacter sp.]